MRILITNNTLATPAGTEMYVRDVALALLRRGHQPVAYSTQLGKVAQMLHDATVPVIDDLRKLAIKPDIIHGHHHLDTMTAMLHFPQTPAVYFCHGWVTWEEMPPLFPTLQHYVAVDDLCFERLSCEHGIAPEHIHTIRNFVDLSRFDLRDALPGKPRRALVFSNRANEQGYLGVIRQACAERDIAVDVMGAAENCSSETPEKFLGDYDIVFAKARSAMEAMACGAAVITCDSFGLGGMITQENYARSRALNFGMRTLHRTICVPNILEALDRYDARDAHAVALRSRIDTDMEPAIDAILQIYAETIKSHAHATISESAQMAAAAEYLRKISVEAKLRGHADKLRMIAHAEQETQRLRGELAEQQIERIRQRLEAMRRMSPGDVAGLTEQIQPTHISAPLRDELDALQRQLLAAQLAATEQDGTTALDGKYRTKNSAYGRSTSVHLFARAHSTRNSFRDALSARLKLLRARNEHDELIENLYDEILAERDGTLTGRPIKFNFLQHELMPLLARLNIQSLVEIACGHCSWLAHAQFEIAHYTGIDLVPLLIDRNRSRFGKRGWIFEVRDVVMDGIPNADAIMCRDWLDYLPTSSVSSALHHMRVCGAKYLIATSTPSVTNNSDTRIGNRRALNLTQAPFNLHEPLALVRQDRHSERMLGVWQLLDA